jgi:hypothetical protein
MWMRRLWRLKLGVVLSLLLALLCAVWSVQKISLSPPSLEPRSLEMATAATHVVVDTPTSIVLDLRAETYSLESLRNRAVLLGNVMASTSVKQDIARRADVPLDLMRVQAPLTPQQPAPPVDSENARHTSDILRSTDQYRLNIESNPTVPMLDIYAQAPTAETAAALANSAVDALKAYIDGLATTQRTPAIKQVRLLSLGRAHGVVINPGIDWQVAILVFVLSFLIFSGTVTFASRVRAGWRQAALAEATATG